MRNIAAISVSALMALSLAACSGTEPADTASTAATVEETSVPASPAPTDAPTEAAPASAAPSADVLGLEGLGTLRIGQPVPKGSSWAERGAQTSDACRTVTSPDYPGVYAIVEKGDVRRITLGQRSTVKLAEGVGVGASEADVKKWFAGFREEPHKYEDAPAKYLTAPNARPGESALRFEIKADGKVGLIHVGEMPTLTYVEGCS
ncbi:hypothetical protein [Novosphingobium sp. AP12]|uniref:hypothetical protein n=1 Tax=Novosphingobium sp. AP12 TaxID=1144305 RepID=UPI0002721042|nr:hypothetical protein [Novosphingobium sp. AP12]EJL24036.1 hypothetical protein PMI02_03957 [Novosphingobium sp. AP12]